MENEEELASSSMSLMEKNGKKFIKKDTTVWTIVTTATKPSLLILSPLDLISSVAEWNYGDSMRTAQLIWLLLALMIYVIEQKKVSIIFLLEWHLFLYYAVIPNAEYIDIKEFYLINYLVTLSQSPISYCVG